jgi:hypothetical protein
MALIPVALNAQVKMHSSERVVNSGEKSRAFFDYLRKQVLPIRPSQYDLSNTCNLVCEGCLFFAGSDYEGHVPVTDLGQVDRFFAAEAARGINYAEVAGAEPSLVESKLVVMARHIPRGVIYTNGTRKLTRELDYRLQISLWGLPEESAKLRGANIFAKQVRNYGNDPRAVFVFTVTSQNVNSIPAMARLCADKGLRLSFNHYSPTSDYLNRLGDDQLDRSDYFRFSHSQDNLLLGPSDLARSRALIGEAMENHPQFILYDPYFSEWVHRPEGLYDIDPTTGIATNCAARVTSHYRHFHVDLQDAGEVKCCTPNIDCQSCRLYAQSLGSVLQRQTGRSRKGSEFETWIGLWRLWHVLFWGELPAEFDNVQAPVNSRFLPVQMLDHGPIPVAADGELTQ